MIRLGSWDSPKPGLVTFIARIERRRAVSPLRLKGRIIVIQTRTNKTLQLKVENKYFVNLLAVSCVGRVQRLGDCLPLSTDWYRAVSVPSVPLHLVHESYWKWKVNNYTSKWNRSLTGVNGLNVCAPSCHKWPSRQTWLCNKRDINGDFCTSCCPRDLQGFLQVKSLHDSNKWYQVISKNKKGGFDFLINVNKHFSLYGMN